MRKSFLAVILILVSNFAFATGHCGNDPTKASPVGHPCNTDDPDHNSATGFTVVEGDCYSRTWCSDYDRAADIIAHAQFHGRHGHAGGDWTAFKQWEVPTDHPVRSDLTITVTVAADMELWQNGVRLVPNSIGQYKVEFSEGHLMVTPHTITKAEARKSTGFYGD